MSSFAERLGVRLTQLGMNNTQLAEALTAAGHPVTRQHVSVLRTGKAMPSVPLLQALAALLDVPVGWLLAERTGPLGTASPDAARAALAVADDPQVMRVTLAAADDPQVMRVALAAAGNPDVARIALAAAADAQVAQAALAIARSPAVAPLATLLAGLPPSALDTVHRVIAWADQAHNLPTTASTHTTTARSTPAAATPAADAAAATTPTHDAPAHAAPATTRRQPAEAGTPTRPLTPRRRSPKPTPAHLTEVDPLSHDAAPALMGDDPSQPLPPLTPAERATVAAVLRKAQSLVAEALHQAPPDDPSADDELTDDSDARRTRSTKHD
ncbi:helix-turn-helix domain-containing protein [Nonomuraea sp. NPDC050328]|uniref:helix-turn-helix domain-containing protein n=1 Tax=Nonomuraea sp. NPDC050328 TaxID=3364361 RepID=UPI00379591ED